MTDRVILRERLLKAYECLKSKGLVHSKSDLARAIGSRINNLNDAFGLRGNYMNIELLKRIADTFPDILNRDYLLNGTGEVAAPDRTMRPHFEATARAGFMIGLSEAETNAPLQPRNPDMPDYDFTIRAGGDSMTPKIESGDILYCRRSTDRQNPPIGKVCVLDTKEGPVVKVIARADDERVILHSYNPEYKDYDIAADLINGVAPVVGLSRVFDL